MYPRCLRLLEQCSPQEADGDHIDAIGADLPLLDDVHQFGLIVAEHGNHAECLVFKGYKQDIPLYCKRK